jgi:uncharacterized glyoxalase superfamily protein PhnB
LALDALTPALEPHQAWRFRKDYMCDGQSEVAATLAEAERAGGRILKPAQDTFWGGHAGHFADPDGHVWEVAWNPFWTLQPDGTVELPK